MRCPVLPLHVPNGTASSAGGSARIDPPLPGHPAGWQADVPVIMRESVNDDLGAGVEFADLKIIPSFTAPGYLLEVASASEKLS